MQAAPSIADQFQLPDLPGGAVVPGVRRSFDVGTPTPITLPEVRIEGERVVVRTPAPPPTEPIAQSSLLRRLGGAAAGLAVAGLERLLWVLTPTPLGDSDLLSKMPPQPLPAPRVPTPAPAPAPAPAPDEVLPEVVITPPRVPPRTPTSTPPDDLPNWWDIANRPMPRTFDVPYIYYPTFPTPEFPDAFGFAQPIGDPVPRRTPVPTGPERSPSARPGVPNVAPQPGRPELPAPDRIAPDLFPAPRPDVRDRPSDQPRPAPAPRPTPRPSPDPFAPGFPEPFAPAGPQIAPPRAAPQPPRLAPRVPTPNPFVPPLIDPLATDPLAPTIPPDQKADGCNCDKAPKKKKKKSSEREVCYSGTYRQLKKGIIYRRKKRVPCTKGEEKLPSRPNPRFEFPTF